MSRLPVKLRPSKPICFDGASLIDLHGCEPRAFVVNQELL